MDYYNAEFVKIISMKYGFTPMQAFHFAVLQVRKFTECCLTKNMKCGNLVPLPFLICGKVKKLRATREILCISGGGIVVSREMAFLCI